MWFLCCPYLFPISPSFDASGGMCFKIVAFPGYLHLYCFVLQFIVVGYAEGKKIVINERRHTMEINASTSMGEYKLDQIIYID